MTLVVLANVAAAHVLAVSGNGDGLIFALQEVAWSSLLLTDNP